jgi:hypothetical protein
MSTTPLEYGRGVRRPKGRYLCLTAALLACWVLWHFADPIQYRLKLLVAQGRCAHFSRGTSTAVCPPATVQCQPLAELAQLLSRRYYYDLRPNDPVVFMGERRDDSGQLVILILQIDRRVYQFGTLEQLTSFLTPATVFSGPKKHPGGVFVTGTQTLWPDIPAMDVSRLTLESGYPDPASKSRARIPFTYDGRRGELVASVCSVQQALNCNWAVQWVDSGSGMSHK